MQDEFHTVSNGDLASLRIDFLHWVDDVCGAFVVDDKFVAQTDVVARRLEAFGVERVEDDLLDLDCLLNIDVREEHTTIL